MDKISKTKIKNIRAELVDNTISSLIHELRAELEQGDPEALKQTKVGILIDMIEEQTDPIEGLIYEIREFLAAALPVIIAIGASEGFGTIIKNSRKLPESLKNTGFDAGFIQKMRHKKESTRIFADPDLDPVVHLKDDPDDIEKQLDELERVQEKKIIEIYNDKFRKENGIS